MLGSCALAALALSWPRLVAHPESGAEQPVVQRAIVVEPGDTVWAIAVRAAPGRDPRPLADAIERANAVDPGRLVPGQVLVVPAAPEA